MDDVQSDAEGRAPLLDIDLADEPASQQPGLSNVELAALCWARCVHTWVFYAVFPFLPDLLHRIGIDEGELGYYAGLVESSYSLAQFLAMSSWATFADRFDRKQVLCVCLLGQMTAALLFGFSCHVWQMLACRTIGGLFSASALTVRVYVAEVSPADKVTRAYSLLATSSQLTVFAAPLVGASLYAPLGQEITFLGFLLSSQNLPALLPAMGNALFVGGALTMIWAFVRRPRQGLRREESSQISFKQLLLSPGVAAALGLWGLYCTFAEGVYALTPLVYYTDIPLGGLSFSPRAISAVMASIGIVGTIWALFALPHAVNRIGHLSVIRVAGLGLLVIWSWPIIANELLRQGKGALCYALLPLFLTVQAMTLPTNSTCQQLMLNLIAPPGTLGRLSGLAAAEYAAFAALSPTLWGSVFAAGVERQIMRGHLVFVILVGYALVYNLFLAKVSKTLRSAQQ